MTSGYNRRRFLAVFLAVFLGLPGTAYALAGTVTGRIVYDDDRGEQCATSTSGCIFSDHGSSAPVRGIRVRLLGGADQFLGEDTTDISTGDFSISYSDWLLLSYPTSGYKIRVTAENPSDFRVSDESDATYSWTFNVTLSGSNVTVGNKSLGADESVNVFDTVTDFWIIVENNSSIIQSRMTSLRVTANAGSSVCSGGGSCMKNPDWIVILNNDGFDRPIRSTCHELGHAVTANALDTDINYNSGCDTGHTYYEHMACEKVAWHEGIANFWAVTVMWSKNAPDANVIFGTSSRPAGVPSSDVCSDSAANDPWEVEACHTAALWDLYDDPTVDDDDIDDSQTSVGIATIVNILDEYVNGSANRYNAESDSDGNNHWDFLENLDDLLDESIETDLREVFNHLGLCDGGDEPHGSC